MRIAFVLLLFATDALACPQLDDEFRLPQAAVPLEHDESIHRLPPTPTFYARGVEPRFHVGDEDVAVKKRDMGRGITRYDVLSLGPVVFVDSEPFVLTTNYKPHADVQPSGACSTCL